MCCQNKLNHDLSEKQARLDGICPVRRELFSNCFGEDAARAAELRRRVPDDLIRRVTHDNTERGLMLQRIRDESRLTIDAYRCVFEGSIDAVTNTAWETDEMIVSMREYVR